MSMDLFLDKAQLLQSKVLTMIFINYRHSIRHINWILLILNTVNYKCFRETKLGKYDATTFS